MEKHPARKTSASEATKVGFVGQRVLPLIEVIVSLRDGLRELVVSSGLQVLKALLEEDRQRLCGPARKKQQDRTAYRYGYDSGQLVMGGRKLAMEKPRVRSVNGEEVTLPSWEEFQRMDPLDQRVVEQILCGVSTRGYERSLEPLDQDRKAIGVKRSSVSRRLVMTTAARVRTFMNRPLDEWDLPVILIDGIHICEAMVLCVIGIDADGGKHVLGLCDGASESESVCRGLFRSLIERGLPVERARLFVIDGSAGLRKAIRNTFGSWALIQRCQIHKLRNVLEHLPENKRVWVRTKMRKAWELPTAGAAKTELERLARTLQNDYPSAAASLREGLEETVTLHELGVTGNLYRFLRSTNAIENLQSTTRRLTRNVKRWRNGTMIIRWVGTALIEAERRFRRIIGNKDLSRLIIALDRTVARSSEQTQKIA